MAIDGSLGVARVRLLRTVNNERVSPDAVVATPTVFHVTTPGHHGYHDLVPVTSTTDPDDPGVLYLDLVATDDTDVAEAFAWRIQFTNSDRPTRLVSVPQTGAAVEIIVTADGDEMPAVWLDALEDFSGYSGPTAPPSITQGYVDTALDVHEQAGDPHPGYALETAVATGLAGAVNTAAADATAKVEAHRTASDPHGDRAAAATALESHRTASDPHGDRAAATAALTGHVQANDPHGDRAAASSALTAHTNATDPHGDRAAATAAIETHRTAADPHGDRAAAATALETHRTAADPHGDRAAASSDAAAKVETHRTASDPHGDRAWATTQLAGKVDTTEGDAAPGTASRRTLGTGANQALPGNHASTTDQRVPTDGSVTNAKVASGAAIAETKLALASDAAAGTASRRTLGTGGTQAAAGNHQHGVDTLTATGTRDSGTYLRGDNTWGVPPGTAGGLTPTAVKTAAYTANPGELVMVDASSGAVTITAPATGAGRSFAVKKLDASANVVTVARAGSDTIGSEAATSVPIRLNDQATHFLSNGTNWVIPYNHLALNMLDARYVPATQRGPIGGVASLGTIASGAITPDAASANHVAVTATGNLTLNAPAGTPAAGQSIRLEVLASGAQRVITFSGSLAVMTGLGTTLTIPSGKLGRIDLWNPTLLAGWSVVAANATA